MPGWSLPGNSRRQQHVYAVMVVIRLKNDFMEKIGAGSITWGAERCSRQWLEEPSVSPG